jgi:hypothetical protein
MDTVQMLAEIEAIRVLKARYFRLADTFDRDGWLSVFTDDCVCIYDTAISRFGKPGAQGYRVEGKQAMANFWDPNRKQSVHLGHMAEIEIISATEARAIWGMEDIVEFTDRAHHGYGHYHETYRKVDGKWLIATLHLTRLRFSQTQIEPIAG